jgi:hypothetical protein
MHNAVLLKEGKDATLFFISGDALDARTNKAYKCFHTR